MNKVDSISVKVCGITEAKDARFALELGADKLGFITYEKSPRKIDFEKVENIKSELSLNEEKMVAVEVEPTIEHLKKIMDQGFGVFQLHFSCHRKNYATYLNTPLVLCYCLVLFLGL